MGIIHINGEHVSEEATGRELLRFVVTFLMSWQIWANLTQTLSWFKINDVFQRMGLLLMIAFLLG